MHNNEGAEKPSHLEAEEHCHINTNKDELCHVNTNTDEHCHINTNTDKQ